VSGELLASNFMFTISVISENKTCQIQDYVQIVVYYVENMVRLAGQSAINLFLNLTSLYTPCEHEVTEGCSAYSVSLCSLNMF